MPEFKNVWMLGFEASNIVKVGGLGEVIYNLSKVLSDYLQVSIVMPSHGFHKLEHIRNLLKLKKFVTLRLWSNIADELIINVEHGILNGINVYLVEGASNASEALNDTAVYGHNLKNKVWLFSRALKGLTEYIIKTNTSLVPHIIHAHDWHSVPAMIAAKQVLEMNNFKVASVYHIHLLTGKTSSWKYFNKYCGLNNNQHAILINNKIRSVTLREVWSECRGMFEKIAGYESDMVVTVSKNFLMNDVNNILDGKKLKSKASYIYNGTDWNYENVIKVIMNKHGEWIASYLGYDDVVKIKRKDLRRYLLTYALGNLDQNEPVMLDEKLRDLVYSINEEPYLGNGKVMPFNNEGPLVLMTGRISAQKGIDILINTIPKVIKFLPDTKFLMLLLPVWGTEHLIKEYAQYSIKFKNNLRIIYGMVPSIYQLAYLSADTYVAPSRWEPFGIIAVEALSLGTPVVASRVGGLSEIILDIREYKTEGNGFLVKPEDHDELANAILSLLIASKISENPEYLESYIDLITIKELKDIILSDPLFYKKIRENGIKRVNENFRWEHSAKRTLEIYSQAYKNAIKRYLSLSSVQKD